MFTNKYDKLYFKALVINTYKHLNPYPYHPQRKEVAFKAPSQTSKTTVNFYSKTGAHLVCQYGCAASSCINIQIYRMESFGKKSLVIISYLQLINEIFT